MYVYIHKGIFLNLKKEGNSDRATTRMSIENIKLSEIRNKPDTKGQILYDSTYMRCLESLNS